MDINNYTATGHLTSDPELKYSPNGIPYAKFAIAVNKTYYNKNKEKQENLIQTLGLSGDFNLTPKWKIGFRTGWDFEAAELSYTSINIYRDLHCFEMRFNWIPIGGRQSWNFALNVKASMLQDLKLQRKKDFRDY